MEVKKQTARTLVKRLSSDSVQIQSEAICELRLLTKHDPESRLLVSEAGAIPLLTQSLHSSSSPKAIQENAIATLLNLSISARELLMSTPGLIDAVSHVLKYGTTVTAVQTAAATVHSLLIVDEYRPIIGSKKSIISPLIDLIQFDPDSPPRSVKDALKALFVISLYPMNRLKLIEFGAVPPLFTLVVNDGRIGVVEDATAVIAQMAGCYESVDAFRKVTGIRALGDLLFMGIDSSSRVRENSVSALLNLAQSGGESVAEEIRDMGNSVFDGVLHVAEKGSSKGKVRARSLLKIISGRWSSDRDQRLCSGSSSSGGTF